MTLHYNGKSIEIEDGAFIGSVDNARLTAQGAHFTCWAVSNPKLHNPPQPPTLFVIASKGEVIHVSPPTKERADIAAEFGAQATLAGSEITLGLDLIPRPLNPDFSFYALGKEGIATPLPFFPANNLLAKVKIENYADFTRLIQNPATRLSDPKTLAFAALHCMGRFGGDFGIRSGAICVIGYRILNKEIDSPDIVKWFKAELDTLLVEQPRVARGLYLRWHTSVRLIAGYLAYQNGADDEALGHFTAIVPFLGDLAYWPQALTNLLLGLFLTGYFNFLAGNKEAAIEHWSRAPMVYRFGCSIAEFQNFYAYEEVANALRVVRESYVAILTANGSGKITDVSLGPDGRSLDLSQLACPIAKLVKERQSANSSDSVRTAAIV